MLTTGPEAQAAAALSQLGEALAAGDAERAAQLFAETSYWRDLVTFTWNITTMESRPEVREMLQACLATTQPTNFRLSETEAVTEAGDVITAWFEFETNVARGTGIMRLHDGQIVNLLTAMSELKGFEEKSGRQRPLGTRHRAEPGGKSWREKRDDEVARLGYEDQPYVVIIGGGQGGIALGARLRQLDVPTIIIERNARAGDSWRNRYKSLCLHDPVWYDHLPYIKFPDNWPVFAPKDKLGDWLEMYTKVMELNYWSSTEAESARYDAESGTWVVEVVREGKPITLRPKHVVFACGVSGAPNVPEFPGADTFKGEQHHSSQHPGPDPYAGKRVVVIGSNNSAHDICAALYEGGVDVTMIQRSSTHVVRSDLLMEHALGDLYSERALENGIDVAKADLISAAIPYRQVADVQRKIYDRIRVLDADFYSALEKAGFDVDFGDDESGLFLKYMRRGSGYYIDVGASQLIIDGKIKLKRGQVVEITPDAVVLDSGESVPADVIVYATGYGSMNHWVGEIVSKEAADTVGKVWGLGSGTTKDPGPWEGEPRNMWKPTQIEGLWFHGGNLHQSRHYSLYLALQLKARQEGIATPVYRLAPVHHTA